MLNLGWEIVVIVLFRIVSIISVVLSLSFPARSAETDQYLTWELELADSGPAFNAFLNEEAPKFLERINARTVPVNDAYELSQEFYLYMFQGLHQSRVRRWLWESDAVERYPDNSVSFFEYQKMSMYKDPAFPFILPMARTVRMGDIYLGMDKIGHFFGFGRRYAKRYHDLMEAGVPAEEALQRTIKVSISTEGSLVGGLTDGIYAYGDLEANYQGFLFSKDLVEGESPVFNQDESGDWVQERPMDIIPFFTPDFDESWNPCLFTRLRKKHVLPLIKENYCEKRSGKIITARFERYKKYPRSVLMESVHAHFQEKSGEGNLREQELQSLDCLCDPDCTKKEE